MSDLLESSLYSVEQAKRRIDEFAEHLVAFRDSNPYREVIESNEDATYDIYKIKLVKPLPRPIRGIAFEIVSHLRASLDQAGRATAVAAGQRGAKTKFPFGDNAAEVLSRGTGESKHIPKEIFDLMVTFKPYEAGNHPLWALNKLCNTGKHDLVVPLPIIAGDSYIDHFEIDSAPRFNWPPRWDSTKNEMIFLILPTGGKAKYKFQMRMPIAIGKVKGVEGNPALNVFNVIHAEVARCLSVISEEAIRIGLG